jgi:hypothetical protein
MKTKSQDENSTEERRKKRGDQTGFLTYIINWYSKEFHP